jgi:hypothetical protein
MTEVYAPDIIISEAAGLISTALENIELPAQNGFVPGSNYPTTPITIFQQAFDPQASKIDAPCLYMEVVNGSSGSMVGISQNDTCTLQITVVLYVHSLSTDKIWLSRICHLILVALGKWKYIKDAMMALGQKEGLIQWTEEDVKPVPLVVGKLYATCRMPTPADIAEFYTEE